MTVTTRRWRFPGKGRAPLARDLHLASGFYTPTLTNVANLDGSTAARLRFMRLDDIVTVHGKVTVNPTVAGALTRLGMSLPIASKFTAAEDCGGVATMTEIPGDTAGIIADATNDWAEVRWYAHGPTEQVMSVMFQYVVLA